VDGSQGKCSSHISPPVSGPAVWCGSPAVDLSTKACRASCYWHKVGPGWPPPGASRKTGPGRGRWWGGWWGRRDLLRWCSEARSRRSGPPAREGPRNKTRNRPSSPERRKRAVKVETRSKHRPAPQSPIHTTRTHHWNLSGSLAEVHFRIGTESPSVTTIERVPVSGRAASAMIGDYQIETCRLMIWIYLSGLGAGLDKAWWATATGPVCLVRSTRRTLMGLEDRRRPVSHPLTADRHHA